MKRKQPNAAPTVNQIRRAIAAAKALGRDERLGSELGRLSMYPMDNGKPLVTREQYLAGSEFARLASKYAFELGSVPN